MTSLRPYWSVVPLAAFAIVLLVVGLFTADEFAAVGWGFVGAAIVRTVDVAQKRNRASAAALEARARDLDETRRLLYMALSQQSSSAEVIGTIVNALAHHGVDSRATVSEAVKYLAEEHGEARHNWILGQIHRITEELDRLPRA